MVSTATPLLVTVAISPSEITITVLVWGSTAGMSEARIVSPSASPTTRGEIIRAATIFPGSSVVITTTA